MNWKGFAKSKKFNHEDIKVLSKGRGLTMKERGFAKR
jgi:hypothetical protein